MNLIYIPIPFPIVLFRGDLTMANQEQITIFYDGRVYVFDIIELQVIIKNIFPQNYNMCQVGSKFAAAAHPKI